MFSTTCGSILFSTEFEQQDVGAVDMTPWRFAKPVGLLLILIVFTIYITLADFPVLTTNGG